MTRILRPFLVVTLILVLGWVLFSNAINTNGDPVLGIENNSTQASTNTNHSSFEFDFEGTQYKASWVSVDSASTKLRTNFQAKKSAKNLFEENDCTVLINGSFYKTNNQDNSPIGLFVSEGKTISEYENNSLFDGILSINTLGVARITSSAPKDTLLYAVQTGPILRENNFKKNLSLERDKNSRRMIAAVSGSNNLLFMSIYGAQSSFFGPELAKLPAIISLINEELNLNIADAINLDGGTASAFFAEEINLSEATPIGSYFCAN